MSISSYAATTTTGQVYQSVGNTAITFMSFCNYSGSSVTANVFVVPSGGTANNSTIVYANLALTPGDTYQLYLGGEKLLLANADAVFANVSTNSAVTIVTSYTSI